jgi:hypothetical protein
VAGLTALRCLQWVERQCGEWREHDATLARAWCDGPTDAVSPALPLPRAESSVRANDRVIVIPQARVDVGR